MIGRLFLLLVACMVVAAGALMVGPVSVPMGEVWNAIQGQADPSFQTIIMSLRLPRVLLAAQVGAGLAVSGAVFQALLRNPLAEPYVLGVSSGAALGAVAAIVFGTGVSSVVGKAISASSGSS